jgi:UDP-2-acetamido-3-amino-2,3-dideoxy-glucuronate N-acetyltransferase
VSAAAPAFVHETALVEAGVALGEGTKVWDNVHIRRGARIGRCCILGEKTYVAYDVTIGDFCKLNASVYVCAQVTIEDFVMLSAHTVFTNDRFPRAGDRDLRGLETSDVTDETLATRVCRGTTVGANATIGPGLVLGAFSMVGMGSVVTKPVPAYGLVAGNPARLVGWVCQCGRPLERFAPRAAPVPEAPPRALHCSACERPYLLDASGLRPA